MKLFRRLIIFSVFCYATMCGLMYANQRNMMYFPATERIAPVGTALQGVREITVTTAEGHSLYSWYRAARNGQPTILFFHGNGGSVPWRAHRFANADEHGFGLFMVGYPGYGGSGGSPSEASFMSAAHQAYQWLLDSDVAPGDIVIYGESIGTGVGVQLAANVDAKALVLEAPMSSIADVASALYPFLPVRALVKDRFESKEYIANIDMPLLIIHGDADTIIPIRFGEKLFDAAAEPKHFVRLNGAGHNNLNNYNTLGIAANFLGALQGTNRESLDVPDI